MSDNDAELFTRLSTAEKEIASHTAVCDLRYEMISKTMDEMKDKILDIEKLIKQVGIGIVLALLTFALSHLVFK